MNFIKNKSKTHKSRAQTMVEFALALPVLLMIVYGTLETGRLLFIFGSTVTAARQAVRYGSATGDNELGTPYYQDCSGIEQAAAKVGFLNVFSDINITYDRGLDVSGNPQAVNGLPMGQECEATDFSDPDIDIQNGDRINVHVETLWEPIAPLVPFNPFPITADSSRTILESIAIQVTAPVGPLPGSGAGEIALDITHSPDPYTYAGQTISFTFTITNTHPTDPVAGPFNIWRTGGRDVTIDIPCSGAVILNAGASTTCSGTYAVVQDDLENNYFDFTGFAMGTGVSSLEETEVVNADQQTELLLTKTGLPEATAIVGTEIIYTYTLENTGNVRLYSPFTLADDKAGDGECSVADAASPLDPGETTTCTGSYIIKNADINYPYRLINTAVATARFQPDTITSNVATFTVYTPPLYLVLEVVPLIVDHAGQTVTYTYYLYNNTDSDSNLKNPYTMIDTRYSMSCPQTPSPMPVGTYINCIYVHTVTQAEMDAGTALVNTSKVSFKWKNKTEESNSVSATVAIVQTPLLALEKTVTPPHDPPLNAGEVVTYNYKLTNSGNVTIKQPFTVVDDKISGITCPPEDLAPAAIKTCAKSYTITAADKHRGSLVNIATSTGLFNVLTITSNQSTATLLIHNAPRLELTKTANFNGVTGPGQIITYTYLLENTGITNLNTLNVTDKVTSVDPDVPITVDCSLADNNLQLGESTTCTAEYITTAADVTAGLVTNEAVATAQSVSDVITSNTSSKTVWVWHLPDAVDDSASTFLGLPETTAVLANDDLGRTPTTIFSYTQGINGSVSCSATDCTYTPNPLFQGTDSYSYTIKDANNNTDTATVTITVLHLVDAVNDTATTDPGLPVTTSVLANDSLGTVPTVIDSYTQPSNGTVICTASDCTYTPVLVFTGIDSYTYTIRDSNNNTDTATVNVAVGFTPPINAVSDYDYIHTGETIAYPVLANDNLGTQPTTIISWTQGANGTVSCSGSTCTYVPVGGWEGIQTYTYTIQDSLGFTDTTTVTVNVHHH